MHKVEEICRAAEKHWAEEAVHIEESRQRAAEQVRMENEQKRQQEAVHIKAKQRRQHERAEQVWVEQATVDEVHPGPCALCIRSRCWVECKAHTGARKVTVCQPCQLACKRCSWTTRESEVSLESRTRGWTSQRRVRVEVVLPKDTSACKNVWSSMESEDERAEEEGDN